MNLAISSAKWAAVLAMAVAVRLVSWPHSPPGSPALNPFDGDCHYHRLRAEQIARDYPRVEWKDPDLGDGGIDIPWPPLFDEVIASAALVLGGGEPTREHVAYAAAWTPVVIGVATVLLVGWLGGILLGSEMALGAAAMAALSGPHATYSLFGRSDQHVLELFLTVAILIAYAKGISAIGARARTLAALAVGVAIALGFWNWPGSALNLLFLAGFVSAWHILSPRDVPRATTPAAMLASGCGAGAAILAATVALLGPPGALGRVSILGVTGFPALLTAGTALFGVQLLTVRHLRRDAGPGRRALEVVVAGVIALSAVAISPAVRGGIEHGLLALRAGNLWYETIGEFAPMVFGGQQPLVRDMGDALAWYGFLPLAALLGALGLRDRWRGRQGADAELLLLGTVSLISFGLAIVRYRFGLYAAVPLAILTWCGIRHARDRWVPKLCRGAVLNITIVIVLLCPVGALATAYLWAAPQLTPGPLLVWLSDRADTSAGSTVYARWSWGHHVRALARRPAVANPFGTDGGVSAGLEESLRVFLSTDERQFVRVLRAHHAGYLLNEDPRNDVLNQNSLPFGAPSFAEIRYHWRTGRVIKETSHYRRLVSYRLYEQDGSAVEGSPALGSLRLLRETEPADRKKSDRPAYSLYGVVPGARIMILGAVPGERVTAATRVRTNTGREFRWQTTFLADDRGSAELPVPYATGANGSSIAEPYELSAGTGRRSILVSEEAVLSGETIEITLDPQSPPVAASRAGGKSLEAVP